MARKLLASMRALRAVGVPYTDEQIAQFLVKSGYLADGQSWRELDEAVVARGLVQSERLRASLVAHLAQVHAA